MHQEENARNAFATKPTVLISLATLVLAFVAVGWTGGMPAANAQQGSAPVTVVNTPLPVSLSGTGTTTGNVNASQADAWSVGVTSLPSVQLAPGTTVGVTGVDVNVNAKNAFVVDLCAKTGGINCSVGPSSMTLPVGTRYVIEQVSGRCLVNGESIAGVVLNAHVNGQDHSYQFKDEISAPDHETTEGYFFQQTHVYADGGVENGLSLDVATGGSGIYSVCHVTLSGHLVNTASIIPTQPREALEDGAVIAGGLVSCRLLSAER